MAHSRIINCTWDEDTKVASVTLSSQWGIFTEYAKPHDEDIDIANKWIGWHIAEYKCRIDLYQKKASAMRERYYGINYYSDMLHDASKFHYAVRYAYNDWRRTQSKYNYLKDNFHTFCKDQVESRRKFLEDLEKKNL